jgi:hypothetical protein
MTQKQIKERIISWCKKNEIKEKEIKKILHIHLHCFVVGFAAPACLVVARPWVESAEHLKRFDKENPLNTVNNFDNSLRPGDWCITAFICTQYRSFPIAISHETFYGKIK